MVFLDEIQSHHTGSISKLLKAHEPKNYITAKSKTFQVFNDHAYVHQNAEHGDPILQRINVLPQMIMKLIPCQKMIFLSRFLRLHYKQKVQFWMQINSEQKLREVMDESFEFLVRDGIWGHEESRDLVNKTSLHQRRHAIETIEKSKMDILNDELVSKDEMECSMENILRLVCGSNLRKRSLMIASMLKDNINQDPPRYHEKQYLLQKANVLVINRENIDQY